MSITDTRVGWIGTGKMGSPMSRRLVGAGAVVAVYDPVADNMAAAVAEGARAGLSNRDVAGEADIVFSMIPNDAVLRDVALGDSGILSVLKPDAIYVDMSTVSPEASASVADAAADAGIAYLRAPVSGSTVLAEAGKLTIMASGPEAAYERCAACFDAMGAKRFYLGDSEQARYLKLAINLLVGTSAAVLAEALTLGRKGGLDWQQMLDIVGESVAASPFVTYSLPPLKARSFAPAFTTDQMIKDMALICDAAANVGVPAAIAEAVRQLYVDTAAGGFGEDNLTATIRQVEQAVGLGEPE